MPQLGASPADDLGHAVAEPLQRRANRLRHAVRAHAVQDLAELAKGVSAARRLGSSEDAAELSEDSRGHHAAGDVVDELEREGRGQGYSMLLLPPRRCGRLDRPRWGGGWPRLRQLRR